MIVTRPKPHTPNAGPLAGSLPRCARGAQRRQALIDAASEVFLEFGYEGASIDEMTRRSGGSKASLYSYFGSKEGLFLEMIATRMELFGEDLRMPTSINEPIDEVLFAVGQRYLQAVTQPDQLSLFRLMVAEAGRFPELTSRFFTEGQRRVRTRFAEYLSLQHQAGRIDCPDPLRASNHFFELIKGTPHLRATLGLPAFAKGASPSAHVTSVLKLFLHGCGTKKLRSESNI